MLDPPTPPDGTTHDATAPLAAEPRDAALPETIGRYRVISVLGRGGMGVVYEAEQASPRRRVAVKVIRGGHTVDEHHIRMFQREIETLALLKHPNIGAIYESGRTGDGHHFFAMELVRGRTLGEWIAERPSADRRDEQRYRLQLFRKIADAVHYAHRRGVIHRDLKPSNIVVAEEMETDSAASGSGVRLPGVKMLDFGLARITDGDVALSTYATEVGVIKGTLAYMSPEQARANPAEIDLRSDVYALGALLHEMLTGSPPHDIRSASLPEAVRIICEDPAPRLGQSTAHRFDVDLVTIVGKALSKEAERRYESAAALSDDVGRYLASQPILARPPTTAYQLRKFAARNRALVGGVAATFVALVAGIAVSTALGLREAAQRRAAEEARADLQTVVDFQTGMLRRVDPESMGRTLMTDLRRRVKESGDRGSATPEEVRATLAGLDGVNGTTTALHLIEAEVLEPAAASVDAEPDLDPLIAAQLHESLAQTFVSLGLYEGAEKHRARQVAILESERGPEATETLAARTRLASIWALLGRDEDAERLLRETLETQERVVPDRRQDVLDTMDDLAGVIDEQGRWDEAVALHRETLEGRRRLFGEDSRQTLTSQRHLAWALFGAGQAEEAESLYVDGIRRGRRLDGDDDFSTVSAMTNLASIYEQEDRAEEAEKLYREVLEIRRRTVGDEHPATLTAQHNLATLFLNQGRLEEAEDLQRRTLEMRRRVLGPLHPHTLSSTRNLGLITWDLGQDEESEALLGEALAGYRRVLGTDHPSTLQALSDLAIWHVRHGEPGKAEPLLEEQVEILRRRHTDGDVALFSSLADLANVRKRLGRFDDAEALYHEALEGLRAAGDPGAAIVAYNLACLAAVRGRPDEAIASLRGAIDAGFDYADVLRDDPELDTIRGRPEFSEIVALAGGAP